MPAADAVGTHTQALKNGQAISPSQLGQLWSGRCFFKKAGIYGINWSQYVAHCLLINHRSAWHLTWQFIVCKKIRFICLSINHHPTKPINVKSHWKTSYFNVPVHRALKMVIFIQVKCCVYGSKDRPSNGVRQADGRIYMFSSPLSWWSFADDQCSNSQRLN